MITTTDRRCSWDEAEAAIRAGVWAMPCYPEELNAVRVKASKLSKRVGFRLTVIYEPPAKATGIGRAVVRRWEAPPIPQQQPAAWTPAHVLDDLAALRQAIRQTRADLTAERLAASTEGR